MVLRQLEYLTALAREAHFGRAAAACNVSQPALSVAVRKLEQELGLELVHRDRRKGELTEDGQALLRWADLALAGVDGMKSEAARLANELRGRLRLGVIPTALPAVGRIVRPLLRRYPAIDVDVASMPSTEIELQLAAHGIDAGITYLDNEPLGEVNATPIYEERYLLLTPAPRDGASIAWAELDGASVCLLRSEMQNRRIIDSILEQAGVRVLVQAQTNSISALLSFARAGWPCIVSHAWLELFGTPTGMCALELTAPEITHQIGLVTPMTDLVQPTVRVLQDGIEALSLD
jgi:DNA-binding transcriptional LysR family regulator